MKHKSCKSLLAGIWSLGFCLSALPVHAQTLKTVEPNVLTIAADMAWPPYTYFDNHVPAGFDVELAHKIGAQLGIKVNIMDTRFASLITGLVGGKFDFLTTLYITPARAKQVDYVPYLKTGLVLMTRQDSTYQPQTMADLCGKKVANLKGGAWIPSQGKFSTDWCVPNGKGEILVQEYETSQLAAQALLAGVADVQSDDAAVAQMLVEQTRGRLRISSKELLESVAVGYAVAKGNRQMAQHLQDALAALKRNGEYQALLTRYGLAEPTAEDIAAAYAAR